MLALLFLAGAALTGACLTRRVLRGLLDGVELLLWGTVVGWMLSTLGVYALARVQGRLTYALMVWATLCVLLAAALLLLPSLTRLRRTIKLSHLRQPQHLGLALVFLLFAPVYWRLFSTHMLARGEGGVYSGGATWYDLSFHAALAASFLHGENFPPVYTPLPPAPLLYPFLPDFQTAALMSAGLSQRAALLATALPLAFIITGIFYTFALRIARSQRAAALATLLFLLNGGLGFLDLWRDYWQSGQSFFDFWNALALNYANNWDRGIHWTNLVVDTFLPQRTSLYGLSAGLMIFTLFAVVWRREASGDGKNEADEGAGAQDKGGKAETDESGKGEGENRGSDAPCSRTLLLAAGVLAGLLPLFHTHTYMAVGLVSVFLFALRPRRVWLAFWTPAVLLAAPHLFALARHADAGSFVRLQPGWMGHGEANLPLYLLRNFGLPLLLGGLAWLEAPRAWRTFYLAFVLLLVFSLVVVVSPNVFDNGKLTFYWHALNSVLVAAWLLKLADARGQRLISFLLAFLCVASGLAALQSESHARTRLFTDDDLAAASFVREHTAPRSLFLTAPVINQPVLCLAGRRVVRGPTSWLWSHGYEFREREADVRRIYAGADDAFELLHYYGVDFVYLGDAERDGLKADASFFERSFPVIYRGPGINIYDTRAVGLEVGGARPAATDAPALRELASRLGRDPYQLLVAFPRTSFFVYRLYKASYGRLPRREEFMAWMRRVGGGLFVGAPGWENRLETNRRALLEEWAASEEFSATFDGRTNAEYLDALFKNAGLDARAAQRDALVRRLDSGAESRGAALLRAVEDEGFYAREYDTAFVLVHFFAYLGRDPDDPPDRDLGGLYFWRDILERSGDYRSLSRAFLESDEYKARPVRR
jgi:hypothetical protein